MHDQIAATMNKIIGVLQHGVPTSFFDSVEARENEMVQRILADYAEKKMMMPLEKELYSVLAQALDDLVRLREEIISKITASQGQSSQMRERINKLMQTNKVKINDDLYKSFDESIAMYVALLSDIEQEIAFEARAYAAYLHLQSPQDFFLLRSDARFPIDIFIRSRVRWIKHHVKMVRKDLVVSFSRYSYGFEMQMNQVTMLEQQLHV